MHYLHMPVVAVQAPTIAVGDYLFVRAIIVDCGPTVRTVAYGDVNEKGEVTLFENISLAVEGKAIQHVVAELVDALEKRTGYRSKTLEIVRVPSSDQESIARRLWLFATINKSKCPKIYKLYEHPLWDQVAQNVSHNKALKYVSPASWLHRTSAAHAPFNWSVVWTTNQGSP